MPQLAKKLKNIPELQLIEINDQDFGNTWTIDLIEKPLNDKDSINKNSDDISLFINGSRPVNFEGIFGMVKYNNLFHLMLEDDGHFITSVSLTANQVIALEQTVSNFEQLFRFKNNYKVNFDNQRINDFINKHHKTFFDLSIQERDRSAPLLTLKFFIGDDYIETIFDVNWLPSLVKLLNN